MCCAVEQSELTVAADCGQCRLRVWRVCIWSVLIGEGSGKVAHAVRGRKS